MNLRKDHYRSFTRTLSTCSRLFSLSGSGPLDCVPSSRRTLPRQLRIVLLPGEQGGCLFTVRSVLSCSFLLGRALLWEWSDALCLPLSLLPVVSSNHTTLTDRYLGMNNDEERSEMRYVVRIAEFSESSKL